MRDTEFTLTLDNEQEILIYRNNWDGTFGVSLHDKDGEIASNVIDESTFEKIDDFHYSVTSEIRKIKLIDNRNNLGEFPPVILEDQTIIMNWAKELLEINEPFHIIIERLISDNESNSINKSDKEVRNIYQKYASSWKDVILKSILLESYRLDNDIKTGQIVTNGEHVGFAHNIDYRSRMFNLTSINKKDVRDIGEFDIDDFWKVK